MANRRYNEFARLMDAAVSNGSSMVDLFNLFDKMIAAETRTVIRRRAPTVQEIKVARMRRARGLEYNKAILGEK